MAHRPIVAQTITNDHSKVAEELQNLLNAHNLDTSAIIDTEITKFGANQFLIVAIFYGIYTHWLQAKLKPVLNRDLVINRAYSDSLSLTAAFDWLLTVPRSDQICLNVAAIARALSSVRAPSDEIELSPSISREMSSNRGKSTSTSLSASVEAEKTSTY